ncbi:uncharacterized protein LOC126995577 [Eriocheir sinensis]|uniref:uncharacterized protein LOC126995577 n=1 Tax=Eriocheir sinensis TaxID=95602 RepID=UPI0021C73EF0|nr:uncharacterized protein LOC126995577 [Eriocheir sinensis]
MRMSRPGWPGSMPSPALLPPPALNSIAYRRYLRYLPEYRTRRRAEEPRRAQTSGEQRQDDDDDDEEAEEEEEEEGKGEEKVLGEKEARQGSVGEWGEGAILPDVSVNSLVRQYTDMLHARTTDIVVPRSVSRSCSSIPTAADCRRAAAAAPSGEEQPEEEQPRKTSLDSGGGWAPHFPRYRSLSLPWPSDPWWRWRGEPSLACQDRASGGCAGGGAPPPHACSLSRLDSATSDEGCPGDDVSAGPSPLPSPDCRAAHRLSGLITPFRSLSPASSLGSHLGSIEDLPLVRSMSAGHVLDSFRRSHSADSAVEVDEAASPRVSPLNDDPGVAEDGLEAAEEAQDGGGDGERSFCECAATCDDVYGEADVRDEQPVQFRRKSDDANIVSAGRRHGAVNVETLLRRVRGCGVVGCGQRQEAQRGGVLRTPSVVISDHSGDTVSLTVALASSDFSLSHLDGLQHSASSPSLCLSAEDPASRKVSSCSSCSSVSTVDLNTPLTLTPIPLEGLLRDSILPEETARRISSCSTCSYISNSEDEVEQVLTRPPPPRKVCRPHTWTHTYIHTHAVQCWCPHYRMDINLLESVQRRMTKMIQGLRNLPYQNRLKHLNLHSLERRRVRGGLIEVFKWVKGYNKGDISKVLRISQQDRTRSNGFKIEKYRFRRDIGKHWFSNRVVGEWNRLSNHIVSAGTIACFKS